MYRKNKYGFRKPIKLIDLPKEINESVKDLIIKMNTNSSEIPLESFHPSGREPKSKDPRFLVKYMNESFQNSKKFVPLNEYFNDEQYSLRDNLEAYIIFSTDVNAVDVVSNQFLNTIIKVGKTFNNRLRSANKIGEVVNAFNERFSDRSNEGFYIGVYTVAKGAFRGVYIAEDESLFNEKSVAVIIGGMTGRMNGLPLMKFAEMLCNKFDQETVLVRDITRDKMYLVNGTEQLEREAHCEEDLAKMNSNTTK